MTRERRALLIFWTAVALLILSSFAVEASYRSETCISALTVDASNTIESYTPTECT